MTLFEGAADAAELMRDLCVYLSHDVDNVAGWADEEDDAERRSDLINTRDYLRRRRRRALELADLLEHADPAYVDTPVRVLLEAQALAAQLVHALGQLEADRRVCQQRPRRADTLDRVSSRAIAYLRVSTDRQADEGFGLEVQEAAVRRWARVNRMRIVHVIRDEGRSGAADVIDRPGLAEAIGHVRAGRADALVVPRLDRLARDLVLQEWIRADLIRAGAELRSASPSEDAFLRHDPEDPTGTLIRQILGAVAQHERAMIRLRMDAGRARKRETGGYAGGAPPYGFRSEGRDLVPNLAEQRQVARIRRWHRDGRSLREIARRLNAEGIPSRRGRWHPQTVSRVLERTQRRSA